MFISDNNICEAPPRAEKGEFILLKIPKDAADAHQQVLWVREVISGNKNNLDSLFMSGHSTKEWT